MTDTTMSQDAQDAIEALPTGTVLSGDQFTITGRLGAGGFGITYRATDNVLGRTVVIKECFPEGICYRKGNDVVARKTAEAKQIRSIVKMFMREAQSLAKLRHPNIVGVHRVFEENGTAYMVLDLIEGYDLFDILDTRAKALSPGRVHDIMMQLLDAIGKVHELGLLHRDISPDNIIIENDGTPVLIDFGAAKADSTHHTRAVSAFMVVKEGYSPQEFYVAGSEQMPCSDLYALGATFYHVLSGRAPPNSQTRLMEVASHRPDPCLPLEGRIPGFHDDFLRAIDHAMQVHPGDRLQSAMQWRALIEPLGPDSVAFPKSEMKPSSKAIPLDLELSLTKLVAETNDEVRRTSQNPAEPKEKPFAPKPENASKPIWADEFNEESGPVGASRSAVFDEDDDWSLPPIEQAAPEPTGKPSQLDEEDGWIDTRRSYIVSKPPDTGTNWVDRALEKQERVRSDQMRAFGLSEDGESVRVRSVASAGAPAEGAEHPAQLGAPSEGRALLMVKKIGLLAGLAACFSVLFFFPGP